MIKKQTIEDKVNTLKEQEERVKMQLELDSEDLKSKGLRVAKIAMISGAVALGGYLIFKLLFGDDEDEESEIKEEKQKKESGLLSRLSAVVLPYIEKSIDEFFNEKEEATKKN